MQHNTNFLKSSLGGP